MTLSQEPQAPKSHRFLLLPGRHAASPRGVSEERPVLSRKRRIAFLLLGCAAAAIGISFVREPFGTASAAVDVIVMLAILTVLVSVHEFTHLLTAKALGVGVVEFGIGLPPRLLSRTAFGIKWNLCALPIGAFVGLKGEKADAGKGSFSTAPVWRRVAILVAGPLSNIALAFAALFAMAVYYSWSQNLNFGVGQDIQFATSVMGMIWNQTVAAVVGFFPHAAASPMDMPVAGMPGLALLTGRMLAAGWEMVVIYGAILSFSLGVMNLLPISILDGGQAAAAIVKGVTGRFYPVRIARHAKLVQTCALVLLIVVIQGVDLIRVVTGNFPGLAK